MSDIPLEEFASGAPWPDAAAEPDREPVDLHRGPLDDDEDAKWLDRDDPRRRRVEERRAREGR